MIIDTSKLKKVSTIAKQYKDSDGNPHPVSASYIYIQIKLNPHKYPTVNIDGVTFVIEEHAPSEHHSIT